MRPAPAALRLLSLAALLSACAPRAGAPGAALADDAATFTEPSPLARDAEMARRVLTPLTYAEVQERLAASGQALAESAVDPSKERFSLYVPGGAPPARGWGLLVFVSPANEALRPRRWRVPLQRHGFAFVSAARSGNDASILGRRLPLALLAYENVRARFPIDPERVYVGGFSGGAKVALLAALAYPDVFRGALLNSGSERIDGSAGVYLPPAELFLRFQRSRIVFATGAQDEGILQEDDESRASLAERCVLDVEVLVAPRLGHEPLDAPALDRALDALDRRATVDEAALARCTARLDGEVASSLSQAEAAIARGDREGALARLKAVDARYGGLAAPAVVELERRRRALP